MGPGQEVDIVKKTMMPLVAPIFEEFIILGAMPLHKICKSKMYMRQIITDKKANPLASIGLASSFISNQDRVMTYAKQVSYPYLLVLGEKDVIVNNKASRKWHEMTSSKEKEIKLMAGAYHELSKEPNNHVIFGATLKFMAKHLLKGCTPFGKFTGKGNEVRY